VLEAFEREEDEHSTAETPARYRRGRIDLQFFDSWARHPQYGFEPHHDPVNSVWSSLGRTTVALALSNLGAVRLGDASDPVPFVPGSYAFRDRLTPAITIAADLPNRKTCLSLLQELHRCVEVDGLSLVPLAEGQARWDQVVKKLLRLTEFLGNGTRRISAYCLGRFLR
jgi:hypothetical protein